jgi:D-glycero-D-manno-heptose 1,7-bisphosphate phosphatase
MRRPEGRAGGTAVFLDRDGVLNELRGSGTHPSSPRSLGELAVVPDAASTLAPLREAGFVLVAVTNQPDVARGYLECDVALAIMEAVLAELELDDAYLCLHDQVDDCSCRKPRPGMLLVAAHDLGLDLAASWMVGDRWVDVEAGTHAGVRTILLDRAYSREPSGGVECPPELEPTAVVGSLAEAVEWILEVTARESR